MKIKKSEFKEASDEQIMESIRSGVKELKEVLDGKKESRLAKNFLKEV